MVCYVWPTDLLHHFHSGYMSYRAINNVFRYSMLCSIQSEQDGIATISDFIRVAGDFRSGHRTVHRPQASVVLDTLCPTTCTSVDEMEILARNLAAVFNTWFAIAIIAGTTTLSLL